MLSLVIVLEGVIGAVLEMDSATSEVHRHPHRIDPELALFRPFLGALYIACLVGGKNFHSLRWAQYPDIVGFSLYAMTVVARAVSKYAFDYELGESIHFAGLTVYFSCTLTSLVILRLYGEVTLAPLGAPTGHFGVGARRFWVQG